MWSQQLLKLSLQGFSKLKKLVGSPPPKSVIFQKWGEIRGRHFSVKINIILWALIWAALILNYGRLV